MRVIWTLGEGCIFRADRPTAAFDSSHHVTPQDLELSEGVNEGIDRATVDYWSQNTAGLAWERFGDTVIVGVDNGRTARDQLNAERRALDRKRLNDERAALDRARKRRR